jgi:hypothetical protein
MTAEIPEILGAIEGLAPETIAAIEKFVKGKEQELVASMEEKYGVKPSVISDTVPAPTVAPASPVNLTPADATPTSPAVPVPPASDDVVTALLARLSSLEAQLAQVKSQQNDPQSIVPGSGEPVAHNLFLDDGTVIKNHGGLATSYSTTNEDGTEQVRKVVAAYPA